MEAEVEGDAQFADPENVRTPAIAICLAMGSVHEWARLEIALKRPHGLPKSSRSVEVKSLRLAFSAFQNIAVLFEDFDHRALARTRSGGLDYSA